MTFQPAITFRRIHASDALEADIHTRLQKLETYYKPITSCRVLVELAQRHHQTGNRCHVLIEIAVPGELLVVSREAGLGRTAKGAAGKKLSKQLESLPARKHARVAVRTGFEIARRQLKDYARRQRGA